MLSKVNLMGETLKKWLKEPDNQKKWKVKKKELQEYAKVLKQLKNHPDFYIPLRLACSAFLSQGSNNKYIRFPKTYQDFLSIWIDINPQKHESSDALAKRFTLWLKSRGNHFRAERLGNNYSQYFKKYNPIEDFQTISNLKDKTEIKSFWKKYDGVGDQYSKNIPMDEIHKAFLYSIKIDSRLISLLKGTKYEKLNSTEKEKIYLEAGQQNGLNGWEVDRICYYFKDDINCNSLRN